jgi:hypothetical protein
MRMRLPLTLILIAVMAGASAAQKRFYNREFRFGFKYPAASKLTKNSDMIAAASNFKGLAYITLNKPGRRLYDATAAVSAANITGDACRALSAEDNASKRKLGTVTYDKSTYIEGGMESVAPVETYRTFHNGICYEIRLMVGMEKYPRRPISDRPAFEQLYTILRTMYFR